MYFPCMPGRLFWRSDDDLSRLTAHLRHTCYAIYYVIFLHAWRLTVFLLWIDSLPYMYTFV
jgi:hypothetical protein